MRRRWQWLRQACVLGGLYVGLMAQGAASTPGAQDAALRQQAAKEYQSGDFAAASRDLAALVKTAPRDAALQNLLGQALFRQGRTGEAATHFQSALDLGGDKLSLTWRRVITDQLAMALGMSGNLQRSHAVLAAAIARDPDYALNYYNQACAYAAENNKSAALASLKQALERKNTMIAGEQFPDPRSDDSFAAYAKDPDFVSLVAAYIH